MIVVDLPGAEGSRLASEYAVKSALVDSVLVRPSRFVSAAAGSPGRAATRLEVMVRPEVRDRSITNGNTLILELSTTDANAGSGPIASPAPASVKEIAKNTEP